MSGTSHHDPVAFPRLTEEQIAQLARLAECARFADGDVLIEQGSRDYPFYVVKSGEVEIEEHSDDGPRHVTFHAAGEFTGDVDMLTGRPAFVSATARGVVEAYRVDAGRLRTILNDLPTLSDLLLEAFQVRRALLERSGFLGIRVIGSASCASANLMREFLYKNKVPHTFLDANVDVDEAWLAAHGLSADELPALMCKDGVVVQPSLAGLAECIGIRRELDHTSYDLVVIGAGPAGLAAAVYGASEGLRTLVLDRTGPGGQAGASSRIENYMGFPAGLSGIELANKGYLQALKFGAQFSAPACVRDIAPHPAGGLEVVLDEDGARVRAEAVLIATGASYLQLDVEGCERFRDAGVFGAATTVEARQCRSATAVVIGGGNSAGQAALFLAEHAARVVLLLRGGNLRKSMSEYLVHRIELDPRIEVRLHSELARVEGERSVERAFVRDRRSGELHEIDCAAVFSFIGARPHTDWVPASIARDEHGFLLTGGDLTDRAGLWRLEREPCQLETSLPGVFAAGDVRHGSTKRVAFAVGDGALAVTCVHQVRQRATAS